MDTTPSDFQDLEQSRELNEGVHDAPADDRVEIPTGPAWTVTYSYEQNGHLSRGRIIVRGGNSYEAETQARRRGVPATAVIESVTLGDRPKP